MSQYSIKSLATGHATCLYADSDAEAKERAQTELRKIATALYPPSSGPAYAIRRRITGALTRDYTSSSTTTADIRSLVSGFDFDVEDFGEDSSVEGWVEFLYAPNHSDRQRLAQLETSLPEHATLHADHDFGDIVGKARISFTLEGHEYDPPDDAPQMFLEVLLSDEVPRCSGSPVRGEGECNAEGHDLWAPLEIVGGHEANPGVFGLKDGVLLERKVCLNCARTVETLIHPTTSTARAPGTPECEIRVLPPSDASTAWAEGKRNEFRRLQPVPMNVGDLERILDFVDTVRAGNTDVTHLEDDAAKLWNWLLSYMPPTTNDDGKI